MKGHLPRSITFAGFLLGIGSVFATLVSAVAGFSPVTYGDSVSRLRVVIPWYGRQETALAKEYLHKGDMVVFMPPAPELAASHLPGAPEYWIGKAKEFERENSQLEVVLNFDGIAEMRQWTPQLPATIGWISYDYERWKTTPEFSSDKQKTVEYMAQARAIAHKHGKRLLLSPVPFYNPRMVDLAVRAKYLPVPIAPWNLGDLAKQADAFNAQFQYLVRALPWLETNVRESAKEIHAAAPHTLFTVQIGPGPKLRPYTTTELRRAAKSIAEAGADGVIIWFGPGNSAWGGRILRLIRVER